MVVVERTNIRYLEQLPAPAHQPPAISEIGQEPTNDSPSPVRVDCATIDVAFISLKLVLPAVQQLVKQNAWIVALIKPQFEAGAADVDRGAGVIRDPAIHANVLREVTEFAAGIGLVLHGLVRSPITGPAGNVEFLAWFGGVGPTVPVDHAIAQVVAV